MKTRTTLLMALSLLAVAASPSAGSASPIEVSSRGDAVLDRALARVDRLREGLAGGTLAGAVRATAGLGGIAVQEEAPRAVDAPAGVPVAIAGPVGTLVAAVAEAERSAREAIPADLPSLARAAGQVLRLLPLAGTGDRRADQRLEELTAFAERSVDRAALSSGAAALAAAIDEALPALRAYGETLAPGQAAVGCDQVDLPNLCIGGTGDNTYTGDKALLIDLGGNDTHANSAGGASPLSNGLPVSVAIDLSGNDTYVTTIPSSSGSGAVQGSGYTGGIGVLVEAGGNDTYTATTPAVGGGFVMAQGVGISGVGILADAGGSDSYRLTHSSQGSSIESDAQGVGVLGGLGLALDAGTKDDVYLVEARPPLTPGSDPVPLANAFGYGVAAAGGVGVWADDGGNDSVTLAAVAPTVAPDDPRAAPNGGFFASYFAGGLGYAATGGAAAAVSGIGQTTYTLSVQASAPHVGAGSAAGMGYGGLGSFGALHDEGGSDTYLVEVALRAVSRMAVEESCGCTGVEASASSGLARTQAGGLGIHGGIGLLQDLSGNDRYVSTASSTAEAEATDNHDEPPPVPTDEEEVSGAVARARIGDPGGIGVQDGAESYAWGVAFYNLATVGSGGFLVDAGGNDLYDSRTTSQASARARALHPLTPTKGFASAADATSYSQAAARTGTHGHLDDHGGNDTYTSTNVLQATADPETEVKTGEATSLVQGSGALSFLVDSAAGADSDSFTAVPANPACTGTRGQGLWRDCGGFFVAGTAGGLNT